MEAGTKEFESLFLVENRHHSCRNIHRPVRNDQRRQPARAEIDRHRNQNPRQEREETKHDVVPIGNEWQRAMLRRPPESDDRHCQPSAPGQDLQPGQRERLVGCLLSRRPEDPPHGEAVDDCPHRHRMRMQQEPRGVLVSKYAKRLPRQKSAAKKEWKNH